MIENQHVIIYFSYLLSIVYCSLTIAHLMSRVTQLDCVARIFLSLIVMISIQSLLSFIFSLLDFQLSFLNLGTAQVVIGATVHLCVVFMKNPLIFINHKSLAQSKYSIICVALGLSTACIGGLSFYTLELVPSSMSGDTIRHLISVHDFDLSTNQTAPRYKPSYFILCSTFLNFPTGLPEDKVFLLINILILGALSSVTNLLARIVNPSLSISEVMLLSALVSLGYPLFALQYGTFHLLLAAVLVIATLVFYHQSFGLWHKTNYLFATLLSCGVILSHPYFTPELLCFFIFSSILMLKVQKISVQLLLTLHFPCWLLVWSIFYFSVLFGQTNTIAELATNIFHAEGLSSSRAFGDSLIILFLGAPYLYLSRTTLSSQILYRSILCFFSFTFFMLMLHYSGRSAMYYVSRNQLLLLPLAAISLCGSLAILRKQNLMSAHILSIIGFTVLIAPYILSRRIPLALSDMPYLTLLKHNSGTSYYVNPMVTSYSPLLFTDRDRTLLRSRDNSCFKNIWAPRGIRNLAVLGADHQTISMGYYLMVYPSLFPRQDMFVWQRDYLRNYFRWKRIKRHRILMVIPHFSYIIPSQIISELSLKHRILCRGDSYIVYRKTL